MERGGGLFDLSPEIHEKVDASRNIAKEKVMTDAEVWDFIVSNEIPDDVVDKNLRELNNYILHREKSIVPGYSQALRYYEGSIITEYRKTKEQKRKEHEAKTTAVLDKNSIVPDKSLLTANFTNFKYNKDDDGEAVVLKKACDIARRYLNGEEFNTIFKGSPGAGKSHLAMAIAQWVNDQAKQRRVNKRVLFLDANEMFRKLKASISDPHSYWSEENVLTLIRSADLVVLDDLGSESTFTGKEQASDYVQRFLFAMVNANPCIITTTNLADPNAVYNPKIVSRLGRDSTDSVVNFDGIKDKR